MCNYNTTVYCQERFATTVLVEKLSFSNQCSMTTGIPAGIPAGTGTGTGRTARVRVGSGSHNHCTRTALHTTSTESRTTHCEDYEA